MSAADPNVVEAVRHLARAVKIVADAWRDQTGFSDFAFVVRELAAVDRALAQTVAEDTATPKKGARHGSKLAV